MSRPNPIIKLKRNNTATPTVLQPGELAVSYSNNRIYVGNDSTTPIPIAAQVRNTLSGASVASDDNFITTQRAVRTYITGIAPPPPTSANGYVLVRGVGERISFGANQRDFVELSFDSIYDQSPVDTFFITPFQTGIYQTSGSTMTLAITYSIHIQSPDYGWPPGTPIDYVSSESTANYTYRRSGIFLKQYNLSTSTVVSTEYFGIQSQYPIFCTQQLEYNIGRGLPTLLNGSAIVRVPPSTGAIQWEVGLFTDVRTTEPLGQNLLAGDPDGVLSANLGFANGAVGINDPQMTNQTLVGQVGLKLEMLRLA